jgi:predicted O-methyltransferase YrrM
MSAMTGITTFEQAREVVGDTGGGTSPERGRQLFDWVREHGPESCLELGFAHGVSTVYVATALEANGAGRLTSVDNQSALEREPSAAELLRRAGLEHRVELAFEATTYNWFLHRRLRERQSEGRVEPLYDFCFLDGAHTWVDDGFAFFLVDQLLRPGGWILFDDLPWKLDERVDVPEEERRLAQVQEVFDLLVATHPLYDRLESDGDWGWAHKAEGGAPQVRTVVKRDLLGAALEGFRLVRARLRR